MATARLRRGVRQPRLSRALAVNPSVPAVLSRAYSSRPTDGPETLAEQQKRPSFNSLLFQSTALRIKGDKDEQKRLIELRDAAESSRRSARPDFRLGGLITILTAAGIYLGYRLGRADGSSDTAHLSTLPLALAPPIDHRTDIHTLQALWGELGQIVGPENVSTAEPDLASHATSEWSTHQPARPDGDRPFVVVRPGNTAQVSALVKACHRRRVPVTAYSGGTSLEGHYAATRGGVCVDFGRMDSIVTLNRDDLDVVVQPGVGWEALNDHLATHNLFFPPDPGPGALIGGMIGTGCSGTNAYRYGTIRDWVLGLTVVLADGTVIKTRQRARKSSAGFDLTRLFIGSEGTLGLVTEATLRLAPVPAASSVAVCPFDSISAAAKCVAEVVEAGVPIAAVELLDDEQMRCVNASSLTKRKWSESPTLFFKFAGQSKSAIGEQIGAVRRIATKNGVKSREFQFAKDEIEASQLWTARKDALWSVMGMPEGYGPKDKTIQSSPSPSLWSSIFSIFSSTPTSTTQPTPNQTGSSVDMTEYRMWTTDVAVPISNLPTIITETKTALEKAGILGTIVGHVGDGNFHVLIRYKPNKPISSTQPDGKTEQDVVVELVENMAKRAIELDGTVSGEHGVGLGKRHFLPLELGDGAVDTMRKIKLALDPYCLLNCDKVVQMDRDERID